MEKDKIKELIPKVHKLFVDIGMWDDTPHDWGITADRYSDNLAHRMAYTNRGNYLAYKFNSILWLLTDAMRARHFNNRAVLDEFPKKGVKSKYFMQEYEESCVNTYEYYFTFAYLSILDMLAFYPNQQEFKFRQDPYTYESVIHVEKDANRSFNDLLTLFPFYANGAREYIDEARPQIKDALHEMFFIIKKDNIDFDWHVKALIHYLENKGKKWKKLN